jgi:2-oxoglutarate ferredoxin oxidoreductase subunit alpha
VVQAEDELAAIGMVIGASWNGARAFTSTSGPGVSLMNEFLGLAYFAEIPTVLFNVQRAGPSTGMPTRTQQSDILLSAYASHGDTKQVLLFPSTPAECFEMGADAFDLAEGLQTPVLVMLDLDLGMNDHLSEPLKWDDNRSFDRGRVLSAEQLEEIKSFGRYLDDEGTGISNRTIPGTHPTKGSFFTRGTSRDEFARYTEDGDAYVRNMQKLERKWNTAKTMVPDAEFYQNANQSDTAIVFFGTTTYAALEVMDELKSEGILMDAMRVKAFPFTENIENFINDHETVFVIEQNRDAQFRSLLINELEINPKKLVKVLNYDGMPITARNIRQQMTAVLKDKNQLAINN